MNYIDLVIGSLIVPIYFFLYKIEHRLTKLETLLNNHHKKGEESWKTYNTEN